MGQREQAEYDALIIVTAKDMERTKRLYYKIAQNLPVRTIYVIGSEKVGALIAELNEPKIAYINENEIVPFDEVKAIIEDIVKQPTSRGFVGWYYQQFLKLAYAYRCEDEYYLTWDGDTIPVRPVTMFSEDGKPCIDWKREYHEPYFKTISKLFPGMRKAIEPSFIGEHMLFSTVYVKKMLDELMTADHLCGKTFYERILRVMSVEELNDTGFSEFETFGTYMAFRAPYFYKLRRWTSFRNCGQYFSADDISEDEMSWLAADFSAISFEKGHIPEEGYDFFRNKEYQQKLSARYILQVVQEESTEGYKETWD